MYKYRPLYSIHNTYQYIWILVILAKYTSYVHSNTDQYLSMPIIHTICTIQTSIYKSVPIQTITYNTTYIYMSIHVVHEITHWYISMQTNTYQYIQYILYLQHIQIHINTYQCRPLYNTCQYIQIRIIHADTHMYIHIQANTYQYMQ